jgi:hypothetical protein
MYGEFEFSHKNYDVKWNAGELTIIESYDDTYAGMVKVSMNDLRDIYRKADSLNDALSPEKGDRVVLSDKVLRLGGYSAERYANTVGVVDEVLTDWEEDDSICWDFHVNFNGNVCGVHWGDVRKI